MTVTASTPAGGCDLSLWHNPKPIRHVWHHVVPKAWGGSDGEKVSICDTHHYSVHAAINLLRTFDGDVPKEHRKKFGRKVWALARRGWEGRPLDRPLPRTVVDG